MDKSRNLLYVSEKWYRAKGFLALYINDYPTSVYFFYKNKGA